MTGLFLPTLVEGVVPFSANVLTIGYGEGYQPLRTACFGYQADLHFSYSCAAVIQVCDGIH